TAAGATARRRGPGALRLQAAGTRVRHGPLPAPDRRRARFLRLRPRSAPAARRARRAGGELLPRAVGELLAPRESGGRSSRPGRAGQREEPSAGAAADGARPDPPAAVLPPDERDLQALRRLAGVQETGAAPRADRGPERLGPPAAAVLRRAGGRRGVLPRHPETAARQPHGDGRRLPRRPAGAAEGGGHPGRPPRRREREVGPPAAHGGGPRRGGGGGPRGGGARVG